MIPGRKNIRHPWAHSGGIATKRLMKSETMYNYKMHKQQIHRHTYYQIKTVSMWTHFDITKLVYIISQPRIHRMYPIANNSNEPGTQTPLQTVKNSNTLVILQNKLYTAPIPPKHSSKPTVSKSNTSVTLPNCQQQHLCDSSKPTVNTTFVIVPKPAGGLQQQRL